MEVLIIEDEEDITLVLKNIVTKNLKCKVSVARGFYEAKAHLQSHNPNLIFLDINLGDGDGYDLLPIIQAYQPPPKIILMSAYAKEHYAAIRNYPFMQKPFTREQVLHFLKEI